MSKNLSYTYQSRSFAGIIVAEKTTSKKQLKLNAPIWYQHEINKFKDGDPVTLVITNKKPKRTEVQNRYYWGVYLPMISQETGNDMDDLHTLFKGMFLSKEIVTVLGKPVRRTKSTTELSTGEFGDYIRQIEVLTGGLAPPTENFVLGESVEKLKPIDYPEGNGTPLL